jgi:hypothetical protein
MGMRALGLAFIAMALATSAAMAEEPTAPVAKAYEIDQGKFEETKGLMPWQSPSREALFSARLAALFARDERYGQESHSVGLLDFDPFLHRYCCGINNLKINLVSRGDANAVVEATFDAGGEQKVEFETVYERDAWRIDEIRDFDRDKKATVSIAGILQGPHDCGSDVAKPCDWPPRPSPPPAGAAQAQAAPADIVKAMYKLAFKGIADMNYQAYTDDAFRAKYFTAALRKAAYGIDAHFLKFHDDVLDWDPILDANGVANASNFVVRAAKSDAESALVVASFGKGKERASVAYLFVKDGGGWRVDDVSSAPGATGVKVWSLRKIYDDALASETPK